MKIYPFWKGRSKSASRGSIEDSLRRERFFRRVRPYAYLAPALTSMAVLSFLPIAYTVYVAFTDMSLYRFDKYNFIGLGNLVELFAGPFSKVFLPVFTWTVVFAALTTILNYSLGLFLAILLNNPHLKESNVYRAILIIPWALPGTIAILSWTGVLNVSFGPVNTFLKMMGLTPIPWLTNPLWAKISILLVNLWLGYPFMMSACLGGLQSISAELYEAADIDGASSWQKFRYVTFPLLMRFSIPLLISTFAYNFNNFGMVFLLTGGGPPRLDTSFAGTTDIMATFGYKLTLQFYRYGLAGMMSMVMFLIVGTLTLIQMKLTNAFAEVD